MARRHKKPNKQQQELLRVLRKIAVLMRTDDMQILEGVQKCPSAREACALLADALAEQHFHRGGDRLLPPPSWVHPII